MKTSKNEDIITVENIVKTDHKLRWTYNIANGVELATQKQAIGPSKFDTYMELRLDVALEILARQDQIGPATLH